MPRSTFLEGVECGTIVASPCLSAEKGDSMPVDAKTIQLFLPDGEPRGIRIAEITTRIVQVVQVPRARLERIMERPELDHIGVYFLIGEAAGRAKPSVYIGQTEDLRTRLRSHHAKREFWTTVVFLFSKTDSFTLAHIRYLEWYAIGQAKETGRYELENENSASKPFITEPMEADVLDAFETASVLLSTLGFPLFENVVGKPAVGTVEMMYRCTGPEASGVGRYVEDGFVVLKGSRARVEVTPTAPQWLGAKRQSLLEGGIVAKQNGQFIFNEDYLFDSPSAAAAMVLGRSANGWREWVTDDGRSLSAVERAEVESAQPAESEVDA
jgi:hypothetical protein